MLEVNTKNYPVILMGDFNVEPNSMLITDLSEAMLNTEAIAKLTFGPKGTFNGFKFNEAVTRKIDYIFISKSNSILVKNSLILSLYISSFSLYKLIKAFINLIAFSSKKTSPIVLKFLSM